MGMNFGLNVYTVREREDKCPADAIIITPYRGAHGSSRIHVDRVGLVPYVCVKRPEGAWDKGIHSRFETLRDGPLRAINDATNFVWRYMSILESTEMQEDQPIGVALSLDTGHLSMDWARTISRIGYANRFLDFHEDDLAKATGEQVQVVLREHLSADTSAGARRIDEDRGIRLFPLSPEYLVKRVVLKPGHEPFVTPL